MSKRKVKPSASLHKLPMKKSDSDYDSAESCDFDEKVAFIKFKWPAQVDNREVSFQADTDELLKSVSEHTV